MLYGIESSRVRGSFLQNKIRYVISLLSSYIMNIIRLLPMHNLVNHYADYSNNAVVTFCLLCKMHFLPRGVYSGWGIVVTVLVRTYVRTYVRTSVRNFFWDFCFFVILTLVVLDDFFIFWKKWFFGPATPFFWPFFWYIRAYSGHAARQVIYAGMVLFADFESTK